LQRRLLDDAHATVYTSQFSQQNQWLLSEHRFKTGRALIPGTGYLEMVAAAFSRVSNTGALQFENVFFLAPLTFDPDETREVRVQLVRHQESARNAASRFSVFARASAEQDGMWVEHCSGQIAFGATQQDFTVDRASIATRCLDREIDFDHEHRTRQERYFDFGPRWHCLRVLAIGNREGLAQLTLNPAFHADLPAYRMHPALLDLATGCALYMTDDYASSRSLYLPFSYRRLSVYRTLPLKLFSHIRAREVNQAAGEVATFDITLFDEQEQVLAEIEGFTMRRMGETVTTMGGNNAPRQPLPDQEQPIVVEEHVGIPPQEGALTLIRMLQSDAPVALVAVARGFTAAETQRTAPLPKPVADAVLTARASGATTRESVEVALAEWWQELLGVDHVGLEDDFFSLGGHSLIGVRLFAKIKKAYGVDLELAALFEARTVRQIAELIRKAQRPEGTEPKAWSALVPIQPRGSRIPLFCVHAVGGDVLFYQQLANALGPDQPFYGLQSPLASLSDIRPTSLEELAAIYVKEIRAFLPQGPYLIGGASYGGLVAFEMAKQLRAQGAEPAILVLFDTSVPNSEHAIAAEARAVDFLHSLRSQGAAYLAQKVKVKRAYWKEILIARWRVLACSFYRLAGWPLPTTLRYFYMDWSHRVALAHYKFLPYEGKITLMRAIDRGPEVLGKREDATLGWGPLAGGGLEIHDVPTEHMMMLFEPYVASFAELLKSILPS
jgi:thioesterase domain-containing protein/acyl carrier protein